MKRINKSLILTIMLLAFCAMLYAPYSADAAYYPKQVWSRFSATCGETITQGQMVAIKDADGYAYKADADGATVRPALGIAGTACTTGGKVEVVTQGIFTGWTSLSEGSPGYLSETAGAVTQSAPTYSQQVGYAITSTSYYINCINYFDTSSLTALGTLAGASPIVLEGATADDYETTIAVTDPTADNTITIPDATGTIALTQGAGSYRATEVTTTTDALAAADCGKTIFLNSATEFVTTLPAPVAGCYFKFVVKAAPASASYTVVTATSANIIHGQIASAEDAAGSVSTTAAADTVTFVDSKAIVGDYVEVISDGTNWYVSGMCNVQDGITTTQAS